MENKKSIFDLPMPIGPFCWLLYVCVLRVRVWVNLLLDLEEFGAEGLDINVKGGFWAKEKKKNMTS